MNDEILFVGILEIFLINRKVTIFSKIQLIFIALSKEMYLKFIL